LSPHANWSTVASVKVQRSCLQITCDASGWQFRLDPPRGAAENFNLAPSDVPKGWFAGIRVAVNDAAVHPTRLDNYLRSTPIPNRLKERLRALARTPADEQAVLLVDAAEPFSHVPWELLPALWDVSIQVVRRTEPKPATTQPTATRGPAKQHALIVASHTLERGLDPDARREFDALASLLGKRFDCTYLEYPTLQQIAEACKSGQPSLVHLIGRAREDNKKYQLCFADEHDEPTWYDVDAVAAAFAEAPLHPLIFLNVCGSGLTLARAVSERLADAVVLGWYGNVLSPTAADVALTFYSLCNTGAPPLTAVSSALSGRSDAVLLVSASQVESLEKLQTGKSAGVMRGSQSALKLDLGLSAICPAMLINGHSPVTRLRVTTESAVKRARVSLTCDTGHSSSTWSEVVDLAPGIRTWRVKLLNFPALHELLAAHTLHRRQINFTLAVSQEGTLLAELTQATAYLNPTEWLNETDAWPYIPSYVLPDSDGTKALIAEASLLLEKLGGLGFDGHAQGDGLDRQVETLYTALKDHFALEYVTPPGAPVYLADPDAGGDTDVEPYAAMRVAGQRVRFPNEVKLHRRGTCHDLALLLAACAEHLNILPLIVLLPRHTLFGYWRARGAQRQFWLERREDSARQPWTGDRWVFRNRADLTHLVDTGLVRLVETVAATRYGGRANFADACARGFEQFTKRGLSCVVDVWSAREYVEPLYRPWTKE